MALNTCGCGRSQHLGSNHSELTFVYPVSLEEEEHTPSRQKGRKCKKDDEVFSPDDAEEATCK